MPGICQSQRDWAAQDPEEARQETGQQRGAAIPQGKRPARASMTMLPASQQLPSTGSLLLAAACLWLVHILTLQCCHPRAEPKHCLGLCCALCFESCNWVCMASTTSDCWSCPYGHNSVPSRSGIHKPKCTPLQDRLRGPPLPSPPYAGTHWGCDPLFPTGVLDAHHRTSSTSLCTPALPPGWRLPCRLCAVAEPGHPLLQGFA